MGSEAGKPTMARLAAEYIKHKYNKPGNVFIGVVSRLDRLVSGVLVLARTSKGASRLSEQIRKQTTEKEYLALVEDQVVLAGDARGGWSRVSHYVSKNESAQRMQIVERAAPGAQLAELRLQIVANDHSKTLVRIQLITGRKHQIRLQMAEMGHPIVGDRKYGASTQFAPGIALHSARLALDHPTRGERMMFHSSASAHWRQLSPAIRAALAAP